MLLVLVVGRCYQWDCTESGEAWGNVPSVLSRPSWLPVPDFALKALLGEGATVVLEGQKVLPVRAKELGFEFKYKYVKDALRAIMQ